MSRKLRNTAEAAAAAGVSRVTLQSWIAAGRLRAPEVRIVEGRAARLWTEAQVQQARRLKGTLKTGPKKGRKQSVRVEVKC
jgi:predicted site-specific integrase-resolvase